MTAVYGRIIYDHVHNERPASILELGTANGVSAAYMAAALDEISAGQILSVDIDRASYKPGPAELFKGLPGLDAYVEFLRVPDSSYDWFLRGLVAQQSDDAGNCTPLYDLVFIDGAHEFTIDGLAAVLSMKLLKPNGWLVLDDLDWTFADFDHPGHFPMSDEERQQPHIQQVFDLIVKQNPEFGEFRDLGGHWGWACKSSGTSRTLTLETSESLGSLAMRKARTALKR